MLNKNKEILFLVLISACAVMMLIYHRFLDEKCSLNTIGRRSNSKCNFYKSLSETANEGTVKNGSIELKKNKYLINRGDRKRLLSRRFANEKLGKQKKMKIRNSEKTIIKKKRANYSVIMKTKSPGNKITKNSSHLLSVRKPSKKKKQAERKTLTEEKKYENTKCPTWKVDVEDWTLVYTNDASEFQNHCLKPVLSSQIKKIIYKNGTIVYRGCTSKTAECKEKAHYDFNIEQRINTPPCCRQHILTLFQRVTEKLRGMNISHCMISGGVIGWVRNKKMIPYDRDLDLVIDVDFWNTTAFWKLMETLNKEFGYEYKLVEDLKMKIYISKYNRNEIDLWAYWVKNGTYDIEYFASKKQPSEVMIPFKDVQFEWFRSYVPNKPLEYLNRQYGKETWQIEKQCMVRDAEDNCW
eukprot:gene3294-3779_t